MFFLSLLKTYKNHISFQIIEKAKPDISPIGHVHLIW